MKSGPPSNPGAGTPSHGPDDTDQIPTIEAMELAMVMHQTQIVHLRNEMNKILNRFRLEADLTYNDLIGMLETLKLDAYMTCRELYSNQNNNSPEPPEAPPG